MNPDVERLLDQYQTNAAPHTGGRTLRDHLVGTFKLLAAWGNEQSVCLAGLFHSIYGTEIYTRASAGLLERSRIRRVIGDRAEELAYLFCACDRRRMLASAHGADAFMLHDRLTNRETPVDRSTLAALVEIAWANELEQLPDDADLEHSRYSEWRRRWTACMPFLSIPAREALEACLTRSKSPSTD